MTNVHRPADPLETPRMTDADLGAIWAWLIADALMDPATRQGIAALLREVERARKAESSALKRLAEIEGAARKYTDTLQEPFGGNAIPELEELETALGATQPELA